MAFEAIAQPTSYAERAALAQKTCEELELTTTMLIDTLDDQSRAYFGDLPSPAIVIGPDGVVRIKLPWAEPDVLAPRLAKLLDDERAAPMVEDATPRERVVRALARVRCAGTEELPARVEDLRARLDGLEDEDLALRAQVLAELVSDDTSLERAAVAARQAWHDDSDRTAAALAGLALARPDTDAARALFAEIAELAGDQAPTQRAWAKARSTRRSRSR